MCRLTALALLFHLASCAALKDTLKASRELIEMRDDLIRSREKLKTLKIERKFEEELRQCSQEKALIRAKKRPCKKILTRRPVPSKIKRWKEVETIEGLEGINF